jgi:hypothetical protein
MLSSLKNDSNQSATNVYKCRQKSHNWNDEFASEQANGRQTAVCNEWNRGEGVYDGVYVGQPLEPFQTATAIAIPKRAVPAEEDLDRTESPSKNLVQTIRKVDWG